MAFQGQDLSAFIIISFWYSFHCSAYDWYSKLSVKQNWILVITIYIYFPIFHSPFFTYMFFNLGFLIIHDPFWKWGNMDQEVFIKIVILITSKGWKGLKSTNFQESKY